MPLAVPSENPHRRRQQLAVMVSHLAHIRKRQEDMPPCGPSFGRDLPSPPPPTTGCDGSSYRAPYKSGPRTTPLRPRRIPTPTATTSACGCHRRNPTATCDRGDEFTAGRAKQRPAAVQKGVIQPLQAPRRHKKILALHRRLPPNQLGSPGGLTRDPLASFRPKTSIATFRTRSCSNSTRAFRRKRSMSSRGGNGCNG